MGIDAYPYLAGSANLTQLLPIWSQEGGTESLAFFQEPTNICIRFDSKG